MDILDFENEICAKCGRYYDPAVIHDCNVHKWNDNSVISIHCPNCGDDLNGITWLTPEGNPLVLRTPASDTDQRIAQALERIANALERMQRGQ